MTCEHKKNRKEWEEIFEGQAPGELLASQVPITSEGKLDRVALRRRYIQLEDRLNSYLEEVEEARGEWIECPCVVVHWLVIRLDCFFGEEAVDIVNGSRSIFRRVGARYDGPDDCDIFFRACREGEK